MKNNFTRKTAVFAVCLAMLTVTSCGKVEQTKKGENSSSASTADSSKSAENSQIPGDTTNSGDLPVSGDAPGTTEPTTVIVPENAEIKNISLTFYNVTMPIGTSRMPIVTMFPESASNKDEIWKSSDTSVATVDSMGNITAVGEGKCTVTVTSVDNPSVHADVAVTVMAAPENDVIDGVTYIDGILIANKTYALPASYNPGELTDECSSAFQELVNGAAADNINIYLSSGFRSYDYQAQIYNNYVAMDGQENADTYSARPGHSEHQTGLAIDCNIIDDSFIGTPEAIWLANHCHEYGFIIRYPQSKESITGYKYEPWHIRYLGVDKAKAVHDSGLCLEEYLGINSEYNY